jgi:hypothetical protein
VLLGLCGCARFEYRLAEPAQSAQTITGQETRLEWPPADYRLKERHPMLVMTILNPSTQPLLMIGPRSYVVDPRGETHPIQGGTIAPRSYIGMVFPPQPPEYRAMPTFGFGMGYGWGSPYGGTPYGTAFGFPYDPFYAPGPLDITPVNLPHFWDWRTGVVRLHLAYAQQGTNTVEHDFVFERRRVK